MKHKLILFLLVLTTSLSILAGIISLPNSANIKSMVWSRQAETTPIMIARRPSCGQTGQPGQPCPSGGAQPDGNSRGGG